MSKGFTYRNLGPILKYLKGIAFRRNPSQIYGASSAIWDHTV